MVEDLELSDDEKPEGQKAKAKEENGLKEEGGEFAFHKLAFECFADREELFGLAGLRMHGPDIRFGGTNKP